MQPSSRVRRTHRVYETPLFGIFYFLQTHRCKFSLPNHADQSLQICQHQRLWPCGNAPGRAAPTLPPDESTTACNIRQPLHCQGQKHQDNRRFSLKKSRGPNQPRLIAGLQRICQYHEQKPCSYSDLRLKLKPREIKIASAPTGEITNKANTESNHDIKTKNQIKTAVKPPFLKSALY